MIDCDFSFPLGQQPLQITTSDLVPKIIDSHTIALGGFRFDVRSTIHHDASSEEVVKGWQSLSTSNVRMDLLTLPILYATVHELTQSEFAEHEPLLAAIPRFCFWYQRASDIDASTFPYKRKEVVSKLDGVLEEVERYRKQATMSTFPTTTTALQTELNSLVAPYGLQKILGGNKFFEVVNNEENVIFDCSSEVMYATLAKSAGLDVSFDKRHDIMIETLPVEVKTHHSRLLPSTSSEGDRKLIIAAQPVGSVVSLDGELSKFLTSKKSIQHLEKAINIQKGKIVIVNATYTFAGSAFVRWCSTKNVPLDIKNPLLYALEYAKNKNSNEIPVIVSASAVDFEYRIYSLGATLPAIMDSSGILKLDSQKLARSDFDFKFDNHIS